MLSFTVYLLLDHPEYVIQAFLILEYEIGVSFLLKHQVKDHYKTLVSLLITAIKILNSEDF